MSTAVKDYERNMKKNYQKSKSKKKKMEKYKDIKNLMKFKN